MQVFKDYSLYYDLLYQDKNYAAEADYIFSLIKKFQPQAQSVLELGCGTGKHASLLAEKGLKIHGIDQSSDMLSCAKKFENAQISFAQGDVRNYRINKKFDAAISLFHVASYQNSNEDLLQFFHTANAHLEAEGVFIFDVWYGPAVLNEKPEKRTKILENKMLKVQRHATPEIHFNDNVVDVNYEILITKKSDNSQNKLNETHKMRYLFKPELELF
jgi:SAM-dependent methyltransferase